MFLISLVCIFYCIDGEYPLIGKVKNEKSKSENNLRKMRMITGTRVNKIPLYENGRKVIPTGDLMIVEHIFSRNLCISI